MTKTRTLLDQPNSKNRFDAILLIRRIERQFNADTIGSVQYVNGVPFTIVMDPLNHEGLMATDATLAEVERAFGHPIEWGDYEFHTRGKEVWQQIAEHTNELVRRWRKAEKADPDWSSEMWDLHDLALMDEFRDI